jgi:hypothetical protein
MVQFCGEPLEQPQSYSGCGSVPLRDPVIAQQLRPPRMTLPLVTGEMALAALEQER